MEITKENIVKVLKNAEKDERRKFDLVSKYGGDIPNTMNYLEEEFVLDFSFEERTTFGGSDTWLEIEYYSNKIQKSIVYECNAQDTFESLEEFAEYITAMNKQVEKFESKLTKLEL